MAERSSTASAERLGGGPHGDDVVGADLADGQVLLDGQGLVDVDGVEDVGGQEGVGGLVVDGHAHCSLRSGVTSSATRASARRRRDLAVPSGMPEHHRHLPVGVALEVGQLDGLALGGRERGDGVAHLGRGHAGHRVVVGPVLDDGLGRGLVLAPAAGLLAADQVDRRGGG